MLQKSMWKYLNTASRDANVKIVEDTSPEHRPSLGITARNDNAKMVEDTVPEHRQSLGIAARKDNSNMAEDTVPESIPGRVGLLPEEMSNNVIKSEKECKNMRFLVYQCDEKALCGGWADRVRGIITSFLLSLLTNRTFVVRMDTPCELKNFLIPNIYNWGNCLHFLSTVNDRNIQEYNLIDAKISGLRKQLSQNVSFDSLWGKQVVALRINNIVVDEIRLHKYAASRIRWLLNTSDDTAISMIINSLFKPGDRLQAGLRAFYKENVKGKRLICSHIRTGKNPVIHYVVKDRGLPNVTAIFDFLSSYDDKEKNTIYIASDSDDVKRRAVKAFDSVVYVNNTVINIDRYKGNGFTRSEACEGFYFVLQEVYILSQCETLMLTRSGLGIIVAYMRATSENLFQYDNDRQKIMKANLTEVRVMNTYV